MPSDMTTAAQALEVLMALADEYANQAANIDRYSHGGFVRAARSALVRDARSALALAVRQHIESTAAELEALRKDAARLDYLQATGSTVSLTPGASPSTWRFMVGGLISSINDNLRAAVDAALTQGGK